MELIRSFKSWGNTFYKLMIRSAFRLQVYDWVNATYENRVDLTSTSWYENSYTLNSAGDNERNLDNGDVRVRFVDLNPSARSATDLRIDYLRVRSTLTSTDNYQFNWEHRIPNVETGYDNYTLRVYGYRDTVDAENVGVYVRNFSTSSWKFIDNLPTTAEWIAEFISGGSIDNYLSGGAMSVRYFENTADTTQSKIHIDYVVLECS